MKHISSRENADYKALKKLAESARERRKAGLLVLDGLHLVESYTAAFALPERVVVSTSGAQRPDIAAWLRAHTDAALLMLDDALFNALSDVDTPSGILAVARHPAAHSSLSQSADTVVLDGIQDPGNLGSILRSTAAAGFHQVVLSPDCAQAWSPKVLRAGMGAHFQITLHEGIVLPEFLAAFRGQRVATALEAAKDVFALDFVGPVAWIFGSEGQGVRPDVLACVPVRARIPMPGPTESLNVAAAAAICLFETVRQRRR